MEDVRVSISLSTYILNSHRLEKLRFWLCQYRLVYVNLVFYSSFKVLDYFTQFQIKSPRSQVWSPILLPCWDLDLFRRQGVPLVTVLTVLGVLKWTSSYWYKYSATLYTSSDFSNETPKNLKSPFFRWFYLQWPCIQQYGVSKCTRPSFVPRINKE